MANLVDQEAFNRVCAKLNDARGTSGFERGYYLAESGLTAAVQLLRQVNASHTQILSAKDETIAALEKEITFLKGFVSNVQTR